MAVQYEIVEAIDSTNNGAYVTAGGSISAPTATTYKLSDGSVISTGAATLGEIAPGAVRTGVWKVTYDPATYGDAVVYVDFVDSTNLPIVGDRIRCVVFRADAVKQGYTGNTTVSKIVPLIDSTLDGVLVSGANPTVTILKLSDGTLLANTAPVKATVNATDTSGYYRVSYDPDTYGDAEVLINWLTAVTLAGDKFQSVEFKAGVNVASVAGLDSTETTAACAAALGATISTAAHGEAGYVEPDSVAGLVAAGLPEILSRVTTTPIQALVLMQPGGAIELEQYCSYLAARSNSLPITNPGGWPDLTGADVHLWIARQQAGTPVMPPIIDVSSGSVQGTLSVPTGVKFDIPSTSTALLTHYTKYAYAYCLVAYYSSNRDQVALTDWANCTVKPGVALAS